PRSTRKKIRQAQRSRSPQRSSLTAPSLVLPPRKTTHRRNLLRKRRQHLPHPKDPSGRRPDGHRRPQTHGRHGSRRRQSRKNEDSARGPPRRRKNSGSRAKKSNFTGDSSSRSGRNFVNVYPSRNPAGLRLRSYRAPNPRKKPTM